MTASDRKRRQREREKAGKPVVLPVSLDHAVLSLLLFEGRLPVSQRGMEDILKDVPVMTEAITAHLREHAHKGRILKDRTTKIKEPPEPLLRHLHPINVARCFREAARRCIAARHHRAALPARPRSAQRSAPAALAGSEVKRCAKP